jgi:hypothetical protein
VFPVICNVYGRRLLAPLEIIGGICHLLFFICTVVILLVLAPRGTTLRTSSLRPVLVELVAGRTPVWLGVLVCYLRLSLSLMNSTIPVGWILLMTQYRIRWSPPHESVPLSKRLLRTVGEYVNAN